MNTTQRIAAVGIVLCGGILQQSCGGQAMPGTLMKGAWKETQHRAYTSWKEMRRLAGEEPEIFTEYGLQRLDEYEYTHIKTTVKADVRVYEMGDTDDAFGLYSYLYPPDAETYEIGAGAFRIGTILVVRCGSCIVRIKPAYGGIALEDMQVFARVLCSHIKQGEPPLVVEGLTKIMGTDKPEHVLFGHSAITANRLMREEILEKLHLSHTTDFAGGTILYAGMETVIFVIEYPAENEAVDVETALLALQKEQKLFNVIRQGAIVEFLYHTGNK